MATEISAATGGCLGVFNFNEVFDKVKEKSAQDSELTVRNNGKEINLIAGRSLSDRFIITLNTTYLGSIGFIRALYEALEHREAEAVKCFSAALANIYGDAANGVVASHLGERKILKISDINQIIDKITEGNKSFEICQKRDNSVENALKLSFQDFKTSHVNRRELNLFNTLSIRVKSLIANIEIVEGKEPFEPRKRDHLIMSMICFIVRMPASSDTFLKIASNTLNRETNAAESAYDIDTINVDESFDPYLPTEDFKYLLRESALLKEQLHFSGHQDMCRHQVYAALFSQATNKAPQQQPRPNLALRLNIPQKKQTPSPSPSPPPPPPPSLPPSPSLPPPPSPPIFKKVIKNQFIQGKYSISLPPDSVKGSEYHFLMNHDKLKEHRSAKAGSEDDTGSEDISDWSEDD